MVTSNLYIICGNCGAYLSLKNEDNVICEIVDNHHDELDVYIHCENCDTIHNLSKYMEVLKYGKY